jgi:type IV secretory pathway VirJ component
MKRTAARPIHIAGIGFLLSLLGGASSGAQAAADTSLANLPLREIVAANPSGVFAVFITGDGGWAGIDNVVTADLAAHGVSVVGIDSRAYLRTGRTPDEVAADVAKVIHTYQARWHEDRVALVGYSRGADLAPFIVSRFDSSTRAQLALVAMLGLGARAGFEFHFQDIFRDVKRPTDRPILPELLKLAGVPMLSIYGSEESESGCREAPPGLLHRVERPGSHHFNGDYHVIAGLVIDALGVSSRR